VSGTGPVSASDASARVLRAAGTVWPSVPDSYESCVLRIDPPHGAVGVFRDAPVVACFLRPADRQSVSPETVLVSDEDGPVAGEVWTSADGRVVVWTPARPLAAFMVHRVRLAGIRDLKGRDVSAHESTFVPGPLSLGDLTP
jgi:hypothetical protein